MEYTIFYGDTRAVTTIKKQGTNDYFINSKASEEIVNKVIKGNQTLYKPGMTIEGHEYYVYYSPLSNDDGTQVGMMFGDPSGMPENVKWLSIVVFTIAGFIQAYVWLTMLLPLYLVKISMYMQDKEKDEFNKKTI